MGDRSVTHRSINLAWRRATWPCDGINCVTEAQTPPILICCRFAGEQAIQHIDRL